MSNLIQFLVFKFIDVVFLFLAFMSCSHAHQHLLEKIDASTAVDAYRGCLKKGVNGEEIQREIQLKVEEISQFL